MLRLVITGAATPWIPRVILNEVKLSMHPVVCRVKRG
jgi:hypothetical protein